MDDLLLEAVARELRQQLPRDVLAVRPAGAGLVLVLAGAPPLKVAALPGSPFPRLHATTERFPPPKGGRGAWPPVAAVASTVLQGGRLLEIRKAPGDRTVEMAFEGGHGLVVECFPPGRIRLLDEKGAVVAHAGPPRARASGATGRPAGAALYATGAEGGLAADLAGLVRDGAGARELRAALPGLSAGLAELVYRAIEGGDDAHAIVRSVQRAFGRPPVPFVVAGIPASPDPGGLAAASLAAWPSALAAPAGVEGETLPSASAAAERLAVLAGAGAAFAARRKALARTVSTERRRVARAERALEAEAARADEPDTWRRRGEALLASPRAEPDEGVFRVPDPYSEDGSLLEIEAAAGEGRTDLAQRCFHRARRGERARTARATRRAELVRRGATLRDLEEHVADAGRDADLEELEQRARAEGLPVGLDTGGAPGRAGPGRRSAARVFRSADGLEILVGRGGRDNDTLTFRIAGPDDFWLHALGTPGAHVVVRNPGGLRSLPPRTRREAASLAAHYSRAGGSAQVDVQIARKRHVRRARGAPPGTVLVKKATTVRVSSAHPFPDQAAAR